MTVEVYYADEDRVVKGKPGDNLLSLALTVSCGIAMGQIMKD